MTAPNDTMVGETGGAVGASIPQLEGNEKLTGRAQYIADLYRHGMLHGAILQLSLIHI